MLEISCAGCNWALIIYELNLSYNHLVWLQPILLIVAETPDNNRLHSDCGLDGGIVIDCRWCTISAFRFGPHCKVKRL